MTVHNVINTDLCAVSFATALLLVGCVLQWGSDRDVAAQAENLLPDWENEQVFGIKKLPVRATSYWILVSK